MRSGSIRLRSTFVASLLLAALAGLALPSYAADSVAGIQLYPGASSTNVEGSEKVIRDTGYPVAVCRHTTDSLAKVVAFYRNDKQLTLMGEPTIDNAGFYNKAGASMSINSPWMNMKTFQMTSGTMICIAGKSGK
jgi:hypothetical protein